MDGKSAKPKRTGNHYIPPPARKQGIEINEGTKQKERPMKTCENRGVKLCNDSSLLFKESSDKVKEKSRRPRRSKRTPKKADAENALFLGDIEIAEPKSSSSASGLADRIKNFQSDGSSDMSVLVERPVVKAGPLVGLENMKPCHPVDLAATDGHGEDHNQFKWLKPLHPSDQQNPNESEEVENQLQSMTIFRPSDHGTVNQPENEENELESSWPLFSSNHDVMGVNEKVENQFTALKSHHSSDLENEDPGSLNSQVTTFESSPGTEFYSNDPGFSLIEEDSFMMCRESCDDVQTSSSEESVVNCDVPHSKDENNSSSCLSKTEFLTTNDHGISPVSTHWTETTIDTQIYSIEDGDWDSIYDDRGDCLLLPAAGSVENNCVETSKNNVKTKDTTKADDDDRPHETSSIIEIYGFSEDLKTNDIMTAFGNWIQRGFNLKWVDNTHALGIFPSPSLAEEVLGSNIPLVKIRPISQGTTLSQERARTLVLPSSLRPKTCTALARRLVSGALGLRVNVTPEERAAERELLREAREKKKLVLKQRDAAWEGNFSSLESCEQKASN